MKPVPAAPVRIVLCHKEASWVPNAPILVPEHLELGLLGDPEMPRAVDDDVFELTQAVPLDQDVAFLQFTSPPRHYPKPEEILDDVLHTILVVLVDDELLADGSLLSWLAACAGHPGMQSGQHRFVAVSRGDESKAKWESSSTYPIFRNFQVLDFSQLGETAERVEWLLIRLLCEIVQVAAMGVGAADDWKIQIFVSHAKRGGLPVAKALRDLTHEVPWLRGFYDARDIDTSRPWEAQLEAAVARSAVVVALRTDAYDGRPWCQREILLADERGVPTVHVDGRSRFSHPASFLPFESGPCVRISDGNLVRILHVALRLAARSQIFRRRISELEQLELLPRGASVRLIATAPSARNILFACKALQDEDKPRLVICPESTLPTGTLEAAQALALGFDTQLITPFDLAAGTSEEA